MTDSANDLLDSIAQPWEQLTDETPVAFAAFCRYRDLPPELRSIRRAAEGAQGEKGGKRRGKFETLEARFERWSSGNSWRHRAQLWDQYLDRERAAAQITAAREMGERHASAAMKVVARGLEALETLKPEEMTAGDILRFIDVGAKLERIARGEAPDPADADTGEQSVQQSIRELLESDPEVAKKGAAFGAQVLRARREREAEKT